MALPCRAARYFLLNNDAVIEDFFSNHTGEVLVLGGGSNVLLPPQIALPVVQLGHDGIALIEQTETSVRLNVGASVVWDTLVAWTVAQGFYGLENLSLIPGSVGAAPVQNIGAYGVELKDSLVRVRAYDRAQQCFVDLSNNDCAFAYRDSIFKRHSGRYVITEVSLELSKTPRFVLGYGELKPLSDQANLCLQQVRDNVIEVRQAKLPDPEQLPNTGSFFKNPILTSDAFDTLKQRFADVPAYPQENGMVKVAAGWLIDQLGMKGFALGGAQVHAQQALVLTNPNQAAQQDVLSLAAHIQKAVSERYNIQLEIEPVVISE